MLLCSLQHGRFWKFSLENETIQTIINMIWLDKCNNLNNTLITRLLGSRWDRHKGQWATSNFDISLISPWCYQRSYQWYLVFLVQLPQFHTILTSSGSPGVVLPFNPNPIPALFCCIWQRLVCLLKGATPHNHHLQQTGHNLGLPGILGRFIRQLRELGLFHGCGCG